MSNHSHQKSSDDKGEPTHSDEPTNAEALLLVLQELDGQLVKLTFNARPLEKTEQVGVLLHVPNEGAVKLHVSTNSETGSKTYLSNIRYNEIRSIAPQWNPVWRKEE